MCTCITSDNVILFAPLTPGHRACSKAPQTFSGRAIYLSRSNPVSFDNNTIVQCSLLDANALHTNIKEARHATTNTPHSIIDLYCYGFPVDQTQA